MSAQAQPGPRAISGQVVPFVGADAASTTLAQFGRAANQVRRLIAIGQTLEVELPADAAALERLSEQMAADLDRGAAAHGLVLLALREVTPHGDWLKHLAQIRIKDRTARDRMQVARLLLALTPHKSATVADLPVRHQIALSRLDPGLVDAVIEDGTLDDAVAAGVKAVEFERLIRERKRRDEADQRAERAESEAAELREALEAERHRTVARPVLRLRQACLDAIEGVQVASLGALHRIVEVALTMEPGDAGAGDALQMTRHAVHAARAELTHLQALLEERLAQWLPPYGAEVLPPITAEEWQAAREFRARKVEEDSRRVGRVQKSDIRRAAAPRRQGKGRAK